MIPPLAQHFQNIILLLLSMRKCDIESTLLQKEQVLIDFILIFFNHSLQSSILCIKTVF